MRAVWKKLCAAALCTVMAFAGTAAGSWAEQTAAAAAKQYLPAVSVIPNTIHKEKKIDGSFLSVSGFAEAGVHDRSMYQEGMEEYAVVEDEAAFVHALEDASMGIVKVIEIRCDLYLGWKELSEDIKEEADESIFQMSPETDKLSKVPVGNPITMESGITRITLNHINGLTIFSPGGNTIYHAELKLNSGVDDLVIRNLEFDEIWEWEDWRPSGYGSTGGTGTGTRNGWSFIKINGAKNVWIDHCNFGIAFDDNVGIENGSSGISLTWCRFGDIDTSTGSMLYKTQQYLEMLYQKSKTDPDTSSFTMYGIMRDNGMTLEEIAKIMGYHSKCHMTGAGDKDSWLHKDAEGNLVADTTKENANERLRLTLAYNMYTSIGSRVPMLRSGVGHLYNCYTDNTLLCEVHNSLNSDPLGTGSTIFEQVEAAGGRLHPMSRGMDARNGASIAADTCVYESMDQAITGTAYHPNGSNISKGFEDYWTYNYALIVNSSTRKYGSASAYTGSSWDNDGDNPFVPADYYKDAEQVIGNWSWGQEGEKLSYEYQTFPLEDVEANLEKYGGFRQIQMSANDWLKTSYSSDFQLQTVDHETEVPVTAVRLSKEQAVLYMEEECMQLDAVVLPYNTTEQASSYEWTSSNPEVATVNDAGLVLPVSCGAAVITVRTKNGLEAHCNVTVSILPKSLSITGVPDHIYEGDIFQFTAQIMPGELSETPVLWESGGTRLEVLDSAKGIFKAGKTGKNQVLVTTLLHGNRVGNDTGLTKSVAVDILKTDVYVTAVEAEELIELKEGESMQIPAKAVPENATNPRLLYEVSEPAVAAVDEEGRITGLSEGTAHVTVTSVNGGYQAQCTVTVTAEKDKEDFAEGDVTGDGKVTLEDAQLVLKFALKITPPTKQQMLAADVDQDQSVTLTDAQLVLKYALRIISSFGW